MGAAKRGPRPLPSNVVELRGNPGKRKRGPEPEPEDAPLTPSEDLELTPKAAAFWKKHAPEVSRLGMLTVSDVPTFALLCEAWAFVQVSKAGMRSTGKANVRVSTTDRAHGNEQRKSPLWQVYREAVQQYLAIAREFGFSPAARVGLPAPEPDGDEDDDLYD